MTDPWDTPEGLRLWGGKKEGSAKVGYFNWARGALRRAWSDNPLRKVWKEGECREVTPEEKAAKVYFHSTKKVGQCYLCNSWMAKSKLECDHLQSSNGCKSFEEMQSFMLYCMASGPDDWALACKPCHTIKTYSERQGISFEAAGYAKQAIAIQKVKGYDKEWLEKKGIPPEGNADKRKAQIIEVLTKGKEKDDDDVFA